MDATPLRKFLDRQRRAGHKGVQRALCRQFLDRGWYCTDVSISMWASGARVPNALSQLRLEEVTGGKVKSRDWVAYERARIAARSA